MEFFWLFDVSKNMPDLVKKTNLKTHICSSD